MRLCQASFLFGWNLIECMHMTDTLFQDKYRVESTRLRDWDYAGDGYYFVTICTKNRINHFGKIEDKKMCLNKYGQAVEKFWRQIPKYYNNVTINSFIIMPNHIHGIIIINDNSNAVGTEQCSVPTIALTWYVINLSICRLLIMPGL